MVSTAVFHARVQGSVPGPGGLKETKNVSSPSTCESQYCGGSLRDREVACSTSDRQGSNFESCVWRTVSSQSSHHPQEVLLAQFSLYVHKGGLKPDSFHFDTAPPATPAQNTNQSTNSVKRNTRTDKHYFTQPCRPMHFLLYFYFSGLGHYVFSLF